ncbi:MAG: sugar transferase [Acholeplasmataceae bacterium]|nr:sugar transferase [Acholeplasmataceae bacterium]
MIYLTVKTIIDRLFALVSLIIFFPLFLLFALMIKLESKGPVFFVQERVGRHQKTFKMIKFRTMKEGAPEQIPADLFVEVDKWLTKMGRFLRRTSLDELPQLINILKGDMSLIGPRPGLLNQTELIRKRSLESVYELYPGISGYAQVNGRNLNTEDEKVALDKYYLENLSLWLDIKIFFKTFTVMFRQENDKKNGK